MLGEMGKKARSAARSLAQATSAQKSAALKRLAERLWAERSLILAANRGDVEAGEKGGLSAAMLDRLTLNEYRLQGIISNLNAVAELYDPVGERFDAQTLPNGLKIHKRRVPVGVLAVIYEARPDVTVEVSGLALKTGNAVILRGGSETIQSNLTLVAAIQRALTDTALPRDAVQFIDNPDRALVGELLKMHDCVDMLIPRGGAGLHKFCRENSAIPVITGGIGICHLFVDESADPEAALKVIRNAKIQRPTVCNALDTALVHEAVAVEFIPRLVETLMSDGVSFRADEHAFAILSGAGRAQVQAAVPGDFDTEWLSLVLGIKVVADLDEAIDHISVHSTSHSDGILTRDTRNAEKFASEVDSAVVYINASTRFTDGAQMGLGAEVAVSTQRLHARGPMGLRELTTYKWVVEGDWHVRL
ncbi:MAG: glutamate-5-semialdehyde dehydrogenase [Anaerolineaceae bacterium]|nr:glutamate-5-semialdehyde dehydrogenase [Anaerolineaceae bacterium]